jgi:tetratricopeptide (TPR) repeat protein
MKCDTIADLEKFLAIQEQALGATSPEVAGTLCKLAELHFEKGQMDEAESLYQRSFEIRSGLHGFNRLGIEQTQQRLNQIKIARHDPQSLQTLAAGGAAALSEATMQLQGPDARTQVAGGRAGVDDATQNQRLPRQGAAAAGGAAHSGHQHVDLSSPPAFGLSTNRAINVAIQDAEFELELLRQMVGPEHTSVADLLTKVADLYCRLKMYNKMEPLLVDALKIREAACGAEHPSVSTELKNLGTLYCAQERYALAEPLLKRALAIRERAYGRMHARVADVEAQYALLLRKTNRVVQAESLEGHVLEIRNQHDTSLFSCDSSFFGAATNKPRR